MQNAGITELGLNWRYLALDVQPDRLREAISGARVMGFIGLNLTIPHKLLAIDMVEELDASAKAWGAVNTIRFEGRTGSQDWTPIARLAGAEPCETRAVGFNTDADGFLRGLAEDLGFQPAGRSAVILGAGGAGRVAALQLAAAGIREIYLVNRSLSKAETLASEIRVRWPACNPRMGLPNHEIDLLVNATSVGLAPGDGLPFDETSFPLARARCVYDMIYWPLETELLRSARAVGCRTANGVGMLLHQGALALELWSGRPAPGATMRSALETHLRQRATDG
jgi:shikimate dehydrogenase